MKTTNQRASKAAVKAKIDPTKGMKQTIEGKEAWLHKLSANNPLSLAAKRAYAIADRHHQIHEEQQKLESEHKLLMLELLTMKESQQGLIKDQFDVSKLPAYPEVSAELIPNPKQRDLIESIAFYVDGVSDKTRNKYESVKNRIEDEIEDLLGL